MNSISKKYLKQLISMIYKLYLFCFKNNIPIKNNLFFFNTINIARNSKININSSTLEKNNIHTIGNGNQITFDKSYISKCFIKIQGNNNRLILQKDVLLRNAHIIIRGNNCSIQIGNATTFGQIRLVNVGANNDIKIGDNCLFSDNIEIWASDTHSIFDELGNFINPEKSVIIEDNVWIGNHVKVLKGVTIKSGAIIGMSSIVTKDIEAHTLNAGNPIKCLRKNISWTNKYATE